jgi:integrase
MQRLRLTALRRIDGIVEPFGRAKVRHFSALSVRELPVFFGRLRTEGRTVSALTCWMLAYMWVRTSELRLMQWDEIVQDEDGGLNWIIPEGKMKRSRDHVVPLSRQAEEIMNRSSALATTASANLAGASSFGEARNDARFSVTDAVRTPAAQRKAASPKTSPDRRKRPSTSRPA